MALLYSSVKQLTIPQQYFTIQCEEKEQKWTLNAEIIQFSDYLMQMDEQCGHEDQHNLFNLPLPSFIEIDTQVIQLVTLFYKMHNYQKQSMRISKINIKGLKHSMDLISYEYVKQHLKDKEEQVLKKMLNLCQFLKLNILKDLVCVHIASKYDFVFDQHQLQRQIQTKRISYSKQMEINLKKQLYNYSKQLSLQLLQKYRNKVEKQKEKYL